jgi:hypothetical protein
VVDVSELRALVDAFDDHDLPDAHHGDDEHWVCGDLTARRSTKGAT